jgi:hypothetical protein
MTLTWQELSILVGFLVLYTKIIFDYSKIRTELQNNGTVLIKIETLLSSHDAKIDSLHTRLTTLETQHHAHHRIGDKQ